MVITSHPRYKVERGRSTLAEAPRSARSADPTHEWFQGLVVGRFKPLGGKPETGKFTADIQGPSQSSGLRFPFEFMIICLEGGLTDSVSRG
jgi:hypothetical protein